MARILHILILVAISCESVDADQQLLNLPFDQSLSIWKEKIFQGKTEYRLVELDKKRVLEARSEHSASALYYKDKIDLEKFPYLNWRWQVNSSLFGLNYKDKAGDDYVARVYVIFSSGFLGLNTYSLNYVWGNEVEKGFFWESPYTDNVKLLAVEAGNEFAGQWRTVKRNIKHDLKIIFGKDIRFIKGVAIMSDTDNSKQISVSYYDQIYFSSN